MARPLHELDRKDLVKKADELDVEVTREVPAPQPGNPNATATQNLTAPEILTAIVEALPLDDLLRLPEVAENPNVRKKQRDDVEAAAKGEMTEKDREIAAREVVKEENERLPSPEEVEDQPVRRPQRPARNTGSSTSRWTQAEDGTPQPDGS